MNNTPTEVGLPVCLCTGNLSSPATQLHVAYDCTSPVTKLLLCHQPLSFPDTTSTALLCLHLLLQPEAADPASGF